MAGNDDVLIEPERLRRFTTAVFEKVGFAATDAELVADYMVWTELHDLRFAGARRIPELVERVQAGGTRIAATDDLDIVSERPGFAVLEGGDTLAQITAVRAMDLAIDKARACGVGSVVLRNVTTAGVLGYYVKAAAEAGMIGLIIMNTPAVMAAAGGTAGVIGAQPFAVAAPAGRHPMLRLDMTNSEMSMVRIWENHVRGESIPGGVAMRDGEPTTDPLAAIGGTLVPAGHRGYALAVMWEVLTGVLGGAERFADGVGLPGDVANPMAVTMLVLAFDPTLSMDSQAFLDRVDRLIDHLHSSPTAPGVDRVLVPGERGDEAAARRASGLPMRPDVVASLVELGAELGVRW